MKRLPPALIPGLVIAVCAGVIAPHAQDIQSPSNSNLQAGQSNIGNVGGVTTPKCVTPTVTTGSSYGANYVVGGKLEFTNLFTSKGSGIIQSVSVTMKDAETSGFKFIPFISDPSGTTWTDGAAAAIVDADKTKVRGPIPLNVNTQLGGAFSIQYAYGIGLAIAPGTTSLFGVLVTDAALSVQFAGASDVQVCITTLNDL